MHQLDLHNNLDTIFTWSQVCLMLEQFHIKNLFKRWSCYPHFPARWGCLQSQYGKVISQNNHIKFSKHCQQQAPIQKPFNCINRMLYLTEDHLTAPSLGSRQLLAEVKLWQPLQERAKELMSVFACVATPVPGIASLMALWNLNLWTTPVSFLCAGFSKKAQNKQNAIWVGTSPCWVASQ